MITSTGHGLSRPSRYSEECIQALPSLLATNLYQVTLEVMKMELTNPQYFTASLLAIFTLIASYLASLVWWDHHTKEAK